MPPSGIDSLCRPAHKLFYFKAQHSECCEVSSNTCHHDRHQTQQAPQHRSLRPIWHDVKHPYQCRRHHQHRNHQSRQEPAQPGCGVKIFCLRNCQYSSEAFRHAARPIDSDSPACFNGPINAGFITWVIISVTMAIFTGVFISGASKSPEPTLSPRSNQSNLPNTPPAHAGSSRHQRQ